MEKKLERKRKEFSSFTSFSLDPEVALFQRPIV